MIRHHVRSSVFLWDGGRDKEPKVEEIKGIFKDSLANMDCIWLLANSIYERTFVGIKI